MRAGPSRLLLAALVAGATGAASAAGAGAAVEVAGAAGVVGLIRASSCHGAHLAAQAPCVQLASSVRRQLAWTACPPVVACAPAPLPAPPPPRLAIAVIHRAQPAPRAASVLPFAPKTSPPAG